MATFSISATARKAQATGTGGAGPFSFSFQVNAQSELAVYVDTTLKTLTTHYTVSLNADGTGSISFTSGNEPTTSQTITILGNAPLSRTSVYTSGGNITATALETDFDTNVMVQQQQQEILDRAMVGPVDDPSSADMTLPGKEARKGRVLGFNATSGDPEAGPEIADVSTLASITADIATLADIEDGTEATDAIQTVAGISSDVTTVSGISGNVTTVAGISSDVTTVAADGTDIGTVAGISSDVSTVAGISSNVTTTAGISANITTVAGISSNVTTVAGNNANVTTVAGVSSDVTTVAGISSDVTTAATNVTDITNFADVYIGAATTDPTVRTDGSALQAGDLYFNTVSAELRAYSGSTWVAGTASTLTAQNFSGDNSTTAFTLAATPASENNTQVYVDGVYQQKNTYSVSGTTLTFSEAPPTGTNNIEVMLISTVAVGTTDASLVTYTHSSTGGLQQNLDDKLERELVSLADFDADATGAADTSTEVQAALDSGAATIHIPAGTYRCDSTLTIPKNVSLVGEGPQSIFDFSNATTLTDNECIRTAEGSYTALPALSSAISIGDTTITFASAPSVSPGDVIIIYNDTDGSWSNWRTYYRAGEYVRVSKVSGSTVTVEGVLHDDYATADVDLYKATDFTQCKLADFKVIGNKSIAAKTVDGVVLRTAIDSAVENVVVDQCSYIGLNIERCFNASVLNCLAKDEGDIDVAGDYGLAIGNSQLVQVTGGEFVSGRHGITIGGGSGVGRITNRFLNIDSAYIATVGLSVQAADIHGNGEHITYNNCDIVGGITPGGDHTTISNCRILYGVTNGKTTAYYSELKGFSHRFINNRVINSNVNDSSRGTFIDVGGNSDVMSDMTRGGSFVISGNDFRHVNDTTQISTGIYIYDLATAGTSEPRDIYVRNNSSNKADQDVTSDNRLVTFCNIRRGSSITSKFRRIVFDGNHGNGALQVSNNNAAGGEMADSVTMTNNHMVDGDTCFVQRVGSVHASNNVFERMKYYGLALFGDSTNKFPYAFVEHNKFINCGWQYTTSSSTNANLIVWRCENAVVQNNHGFADFVALRIDTTSHDATNFTIGETITGGSSGSTATVVGRNATFIFIQDTASGSFTGGETITGGTSSYSAPLVASPNHERIKGYYHLSFLGNDNLWHDHNLDQHSLGNYTSSNTTVVTTI